MAATGALELRVPDSPIPALTERERRFAVAYFEVTLETGREIGSAPIAYRRAFPQAELDEARIFKLSHQLVKSPNVIELLNHLRRDYSSRAACPPEHVVTGLERIAYANMIDFMTIDDQGSGRLDLRQVTPEQMFAVQELDIQERELPDGTTVTKTKLKLYSKLEALRTLCDIHGLKIPPEMLSLSLPDLDRLIAVMGRRLRQVGHG